MCERESESQTECRLWFNEALRDDGRCCLYCPGGFKVFAFCSSAPAPGETPSAGSRSIIPSHHAVNCQPSSNSEPLGALPTTHHAQPNFSESVRKWPQDSFFLSFRFREGKETQEEETAAAEQHRWSLERPDDLLRPQQLRSNTSLPLLHCHCCSPWSFRPPPSPSH